MLKALVKKQINELFRGFFVNQKTNIAYSRTKTAVFVIGYVLLLAGVLGGMFFAVGMGIAPVITAGFGWLFWIVFLAIGIVLGVFGSVFNTFSGLYLAKDNDTLFSMPIPTRYILFSRLIAVYVMSLMFSAVAIVPAIVVYMIKAPSLRALFGGIVTVITVSLFVLVLSCILGWCVAKISGKLKNKSYITVILSIAFIALYYIVYFKASEYLAQFVKNMATIGATLKSKGYPLYLCGRAAEGYLLPLLAVVGVVALLCFLTYLRLNSGFIKLAGTVNNVTGEKKKEKIHSKSVFSTLFSKEFGRFTSSANYMLNCGLGTLFMPAAAVVLIVKGGTIVPHFANMGILPQLAPLCVAAIIMLSSMNDCASASISLEGKNLWILQSLPVNPKLVFDAKIMVQAVITVPFVIILAGVTIFVFGFDVAQSIGIMLASVTVSAAMAHICLLLNLLRPNFSWTNELYPIKQSMPVFFALFGVWALAVAVGGLYFLVDGFMSAAVYLYLWTVIALAATLIIRRYLATKGARLFATF